LFTNDFKDGRMTDHDHTLQTGIDAVRRGDKSTARAAFRRVLQTDPDNIQALLWLAGVASTREEKDRVLQQVIRLDPDNAVAQRGLQALGDSTDGAPNELLQPNARSKRRGPRTTTASNDGTRQRTQAAGAAPPERDMVVLGAATGGGGNDDKRRRRRRGSLFWLLPVPLLLGLLAAGVWYWQNRNDPNEIATASPSVVAATDTAIADAVLASPGTTNAITNTAVAAYPVPSASAIDTAPGGAAITGTTTINIPNVPIGGTDPSTPASAAPSAATSVAPVPSALSSPSVVAAAPSASVPAASASAAPSVVAVAPSVAPTPSIVTVAPSVTPTPSVVAVAPSVAPAPSVVAAAPSASPVPRPSAAPSVVAVAPSAVPSVAPSRAPSTAPSALRAGRPTVLGNEQRLTEAPWRWGYYGLSNVTTGGAGFSVQPKGRYLVVLMLVQNTGTTPQQIPDGLYMVTDEQGRTATFNRQASVDYYQTYLNTNPGDYPANAKIPVTTTPVSVPLLFDVPLDATNLIMTSANNPKQGFFVAQRMQ